MYKKNKQKSAKLGELQLDISKGCTGCGVCMLSCPKQCISMVTDKEGFKYPHIDKSKCADCKKCLDVCHLNKQNKHSVKEAYAAASMSSDDLEMSSSGGAFPVLARKAIEKGWLVCGCALLKNMLAKHILVSSKEELTLLYGSKYVESYTTDAFSEMYEKLKAGHKVLLSGTGCQIAAAREYLRDFSDSVTYVEILCHGVPSQQLFHSHVMYIEEKYNKKLMSVSFRSKHNASWGINYRYEYIFSDGTKKYLPYSRDPYYCHFIKGNIFRRSCYSCKYAGSERVGDITIGDYWSYSEHHDDLSSRKGVSLVLVNTGKGKKFLEECAGEIKLIPTSLDWAKAGTHALVNAVAKPNCREKIYTEIDRIGYIKWRRKYRRSKLYFIEESKYVIKLLMPYKVRDAVKRIHRKRKVAVNDEL